MSNDAPEAIEVFFSYAHEDEELRDKLARHLSILRRHGVITAWYDRQITAGTEWAGEIDTHLNTANIILLLISADFLDSDYCYDVELKRAMERHETREARVIPVILRPVDWHDAPFGKLKPLPKNGKPVTSWENRDEAFVSIAKGIRMAVEQLRPDERSFEPKTDLTPQPPSLGGKGEKSSPLLAGEGLGERSTSEIANSQTDDPSSDKGVDYTKLRDLLAQGKWREADLETLAVMLKAANRETEGYLDQESIEIFPCTDLRTIDQLWVKYSNGRFGFSVQKRIWESVGGKSGKYYDYEILKKFGDRVGWLKLENKWLGLKKKEQWLGIDVAIFDLKAPQGHLPFLRGRQFQCGVRSLFSRVETCKL
jgi:hypothetical protein